MAAGGGLRKIESTHVVGRDPLGSELRIEISKVFSEFLNFTVNF
jgi:hypothetical protein